MELGISMGNRARRYRLVACFSFLLLACCQQGNPGRERQVVTVVAPWKNKGPDPMVSGYLFLRMGCLETLTVSDGRGGVEPRLAESWEVSPDLLTWRFRLRPGVRFHDGSPLTAEAVVPCLRRVFQSHEFFAASPTRITSVEPMGNRDILITTGAPFSPLPAYLAHYATAILSPACFTADGRVIAVIGTGPYRLVSSEMDTLLEFEAFEDYWGPRPFAARIRYLAIENPETRAMMAESGDADLVLALSSASAERLRNGKDPRIVSTVMPRIRVLKVNTNLPCFDSADERRALSLSIDRERIARTLLNNPAMAASQLLPPSVATWHDPLLKPLGFDPAQAQRLLKRHGWKRDRDGILRRDGNRFEAELVTYSSRPMLPIIAQALQAQLQRVGILLRISVCQGSTIIQRHGDGTLQAALYSQNLGLVPDPIGIIASDFGPEPARSGWGAMGWGSEEMNRLIERYLSAFDDAEAAGIRRRIVGLVQAELPLIPLTWYDHRAAVSARIAGLKLDPYELRPYLEGARWAD